MSEEKQKNDTITIRKDSLWKYSTFALIGVLVLGAIFFVLPGKDVTGNAVANQGANNLPAPTASAKVDIESEDHFLKGSPSSNVFVIEYSDFECPFCARAYTDAIAGIKSSYSDEEVAVIYRHFPLNSIHPNAQKAAEAAECAGEQGKFVEMHDMLFELGVAGGSATYKSYASQLGLDTAKFNSCLDSGKYASKVSSDLQEGSSLGIQGTPGFFVVAKKDLGKSGAAVSISGAQPFVNFKQVIDSKL